MPNFDPLVGVDADVRLLEAEPTEEADGSVFFHQGLGGNGQSWVDLSRARNEQARGLARVAAALKLGRGEVGDLDLAVLGRSLVATAADRLLALDQREAGSGRLLFAWRVVGEGRRDGGLAKLGQLRRLFQLAAAQDTNKAKMVIHRLDATILSSRAESEPLFD